LGGLAHGRVGRCVGLTCTLQKGRRGWQRPAAREADAALRGLSERCGGDVLQQWPRGGRHVTSGMGVDSLRSDLGDSSALGVQAADGDSVECVPVSGERRASRWQAGQRWALACGAALRQAAVAQRQMACSNRWAQGSVRGEATGASSSGGRCRGACVNCAGDGNIKSRGAAGRGFGKNRPHRLRLHVKRVRPDKNKKDF
jgi:hypothetical protein